MSDDPQVTVDARGRRCPIPIIELARHITDVGVGEVIAVVSDDPAARLDVPEWCRMRGQEYLGEYARDDAAAFLVRRVV